MEREFWFSQALEDAEGEQWPPGCDVLCEFDHLHFHSDGGLIERQGDRFWAEGYLRPMHELAALPDDAVRLVSGCPGLDGYDEKSRGPEYRRGWADRGLANRAGVGECVDRIEIVGNPTGGPAD